MVAVYVLGESDYSRESVLSSCVDAHRRGRGLWSDQAELHCSFGLNVAGARAELGAKLPGHQPFKPEQATFGGQKEHKGQQT